MQIEIFHLFLSPSQKAFAAEQVASASGLPPVLATCVLDYYFGDEAIYSTAAAFAAKLADGRVVAWGNAGNGGDSSSVQAELKEVDTIYSTAGAFAAKLADGRVVTWGLANYGGDSSSVQAELKEVDTICSTDKNFAAKLADGRVVTWGGCTLCPGWLTLSLPG